MNIWIEYWEKSKEPSKNTYAQLRENLKWEEPKEKQKRYFDKRKDAMDFANSLGERGYYATLKQDNGGY